MGRLASGRIGAQVLRWQTRHFDMQVDAIHQGAGNLRAIAAHGLRTATTTPRGITGPATRARIHRGDQLETCGKLGTARGTRDSHRAGLKRLAQDFQCFAIPLRQFIQKQNAIVAERYFARTRIGTTTHQSHRTGGVMR